MAFPFGRFRNWVKGQLVGFAEMLDLQDATRGLAGAVAYGASGVANFLPNGSHALGLVPATGMEVTLGAADQYCFLQPADGTETCKVAYALAAQNVPINAADATNQRNDLICLQYAIGATDTYTTSIRQDNGTVLTGQTVSKSDETFIFEYVPGTPGSGDPAVPAGYVAFARVRVPANASAIVAGDIDILFPTFSSLVSAMAGGVKSLNALTGDLELTSQDGTVGITASGSAIDLSAKSAAVGSVLKVIGANSGPFSITLPGPDTTTWVVEAEVNINSGGTFEQSSLALTAGTMTNMHSVNTSAGGGSGQNAFARNLVVGEAAGGQTLSFTLSIQQGSFGGDYAEIITATRIS